MHLKVYTDGGSRGNPGIASCAFVVVKDNKIIKEFSKIVGEKKTNNEAEYSAIIEALEQVLEKDLEIISDSELVVKQIMGKYRVNKSHLSLLNQKVKGLISNRNVKFTHSKRENEFIKRADKLVNKQLDKYMKKKRESYFL